jgi:hypothetical protein
MMVSRAWTVAAERQMRSGHGLVQSQSQVTSGARGMISATQDTAMGRAYIAAVAAGSAGSPWQPGGGIKPYSSISSSNGSSHVPSAPPISERYRNGKSRDGVDGRVSVGVILAMHFA